MKSLKCVCALLVALTVIVVSAPAVTAEPGENDSITITFDRKPMLRSLLHPGRFISDSNPPSRTVTVEGFVIRDSYGRAVTQFTIQTSSGVTKVPFDQIREVRISRFLCRNDEDILLADNIARAKLFLIDGTKLSVLLQADFGTIEGKTILGDFFLKDPHTVRRIVFNWSAPEDDES